MRCIHFFGNTGYCGTDYDEYLAFEDDITDREIDRYSRDFALEWAESYSYIATGWDEDFETEEDRQDYFNDALDNAGWEDITEEEFWEVMG